MKLHLLLALLGVFGVIAIMFGVIMDQSNTIRRLCREKWELDRQNKRLRFHRRQMAECLQTCADRLEVFISSDWADEDDQEAHDAALHLAHLARQMEQEEAKANDLPSSYLPCQNGLTPGVEP